MDELRGRTNVLSRRNRHCSFNGKSFVKDTISAHLSRMLIGELIVCPYSGVRPSTSVVHKFIFSETAWPIKAKIYVEHPWLGGTKVCLRDLGNMVKIDSMPIYGKNPSKISGTSRPISTKTLYVACGLLPIIVCSNYDHGLNLTYFTQCFVT